ncbi:TrkH family potassium uptake protein [Streptococcus sciuri]|uniref:TrkH family potassium uptake protein n=1 Tax=Streptococcus sciuri TaxID=2973939 RepID=A0ABT2FA14_9STRE|nr:potassium transporter TrkG [Streptococcus sciuri]MCS4488861.1 TrkH family potassium uptake protein [Streptococcus sciuri]
MFSIFNRHQLSITKQLSVSFLLVIFVGSFLLSLPIMHYPNAPATTYLDHLFTAISMVCVTGLSVFPIAHVYNGFGQLIALLLIQIGGLGLVTLISVSYFVLNRKLSLRDQHLLQSAITYDSANNLKNYLFTIYRVTLIIESVCSCLLMIDFIPRYGLGNGIFNSLFLSVSAFCNAGFDNLGASSLQGFKTNTLVNLIIAFLIISGGLGFMVWGNLYHATKHFITSRPKHLRSFTKQLNSHTLLVLETTVALLILGTTLSWLLESSNVRTIGQLSFTKQGLVSFFQSVTMRTAGFSTIDYAHSKNATNLIYIIQMMIGGAPGGTAGGLKVTVVAVLFLLLKSEARGQTQVTYHFRTIPQKITRQTLVILIFFFSTLLAAYLLLLEFEPHLSPFSLFFEASSALATVGVSMDITTKLSTAGRIIIMLLMFIGRVGPITVLMALLQNHQKEVSYAKTDIILG